jgi:hypothetical protein
MILAKQARLPDTRRFRSDRSVIAHRFGTVDPLDTTVLPNQDVLKAFPTHCPKHFSPGSIAVLVAILMAVGLTAYLDRSDARIQNKASEHGIFASRRMIQAVTKIKHNRLCRRRHHFVIRTYLLQERNSPAEKYLQRCARRALLHHSFAHLWPIDPQCVARGLRILSTAHRGCWLRKRNPCAPGRPPGRPIFGCASPKPD